MRERMLWDFIGDAGELIIYAVLAIAAIAWFKVSDWGKKKRKKDTLENFGS